MKPFCLYAFVYFLLLKESICLVDYSLTKAYLENKLVNVATIFDCSNNTEQIRNVKSLNAHNFSTSILNINKINLKNNPCFIDQHQVIAVIVDGDCELFPSLLDDCNKKVVFSYRQHWLVFSEWENTVFLFRNVVLNINSDVKVAVKVNESYVVLKDVYNPAFEKGGEFKVVNEGYFTAKNGLVFPDRYLDIFTKRRNMSGVFFKATTALPRPFEGTLEDHLFKDENRDVNSFNRHQSKLLMFCSDFYNFSLKFFKTNSWGYVTDKGYFDGLVGDLQNKTVDFGGSPLFCKRDRLPHIDYGRLTWFLKIAFIFRNPKPKTSFLIYLRPLSSSVWISTFVFFLLVFSILKTTTKIENATKNPKNFDLDDSWGSIIVVSVGMFCQQGSSMIPTFLCGRIATLSMFLFSLLFIQFYSGSIISYLLRTPELTIKSVADILDSSLEVGCDDTVYNRDYYKQLNNPVEVELYEKKILNKNGTIKFYSLENGIELIAKGNFAFHVELLNVYPLIERTFTPNQICQLREVQMLKTNQIFTSFQKRSPFRKTINYCLNLIGERGILQRQIKHWSSRKPKCLLETSTSFNEVSIDQFYPALTALVFGMAGSCLVLLFERKFAAKKHPMKIASNLNTFIARK